MIAGMKTIDFITMGCSKNLVDSEMLMGLCEAKGYHCTHDSNDPQGEIVVINTCGFINDAKEESIETILEMARWKEYGRLKLLVVAGCLGQRYEKDERYYGKKPCDIYGIKDYQKYDLEILQLQHHK